MRPDLHLLLDLGLGRVFPTRWDGKALLCNPLGGKTHEVGGKSAKLLLQVPVSYTHLTLPTNREV